MLKEWNTRELIMYKIWTCWDIQNVSIRWFHVHCRAKLRTPYRRKVYTKMPRFPNHSVKIKHWELIYIYIYILCYIHKKKKQCSIALTEHMLTVLGVSQFLAYASVIGLIVTWVRNCTDDLKYTHINTHTHIWQKMQYEMYIYIYIYIYVYNMK